MFCRGSPKLVKKKSGRHAGAAVSLQLVARWQAETLQSSKVTSAEEVGLQPMKETTLEWRVVERPKLFQAVDPEKGHD